MELTIREQARVKTDGQITVAICTRNRAAKLSTALDSLTAMKPPKRSNWEVLVIDNGSSDHTADVVRNFQSRLPIRYLYHPVVGLSSARNAAVKSAAGHYIVWTDDDQIVDAAWLCKYEDAFARYPDAAIFGGPVNAHFIDSRPQWLSDGWERVANAYGVRNFDPREIPLEPDRKYLPFGGNYAIKCAAQSEHLYDPNLGRRGNRMIGGEELDVMLRILKRGEIGYWIPSAVVHHVIMKDRLTISYLRKYYRGLGTTSVIMEDKESFRACGRESVIVLGLWVIALEAKYWFTKPFRNPEQWLSHLIAASRLEGRLLALLNKTYRPNARKLDTEVVPSGQKP